MGGSGAGLFPRRPSPSGRNAGAGAGHGARAGHGAAAMSSAIDAILGKTAPDKSPGEGQSGEAALLAEAAEPAAYQPYRIWPRPQLMFSLIEADGTAHGFQYHALRHPKHQV